MEDLDKLRAIKQQARQGGGPKRVEKQHASGKLTARERLEKLLDPGTFDEYYMLAGADRDLEEGVYGDGVVVGVGQVGGRNVCVYSQDATIHSGSVGTIHRGKLCQIMDTAIKNRVPLIGLHESAGGRIEIPGSARELGFGRTSIFARHTRASGLIPQIMVVLGPCTGNAVYGPALADFIFMADKTGYMFITGPRAVKEVTSVEVTSEELGGARVHARKSGVIDFRMAGEEECFQGVKRLLTFLPSNNQEPLPVVASGDDPDRLLDGIADLVPTESRKPFDMCQLISRIVDNGDFLEVKAEFARNMVVGLGRLDGHTVGFVANQPLVFGGALTADSSDKQARFIRFCDAFNIPVVFLVDNPGFMPGIDQEHQGIIRHGAKVLFAICEATVPMITVLIRKCYGGGNPAMGADKDQGIDRVFAWPGFEASVLGAEASIEIFFRDEIAKAENPAEYRALKIKEFREKYANPYNMAASGRLDDVIEPRDTRRVLIHTLRTLAHKTEQRETKKHANMPL